MPMTKTRTRLRELVDVPDYAAAQKKFVDLQTQRDEVNSLINDALSDVSGPNQGVDPRDTAARQLLGDEVEALPPEEAKLRKKLSSLYDEKSIILRALTIQETRLEEARLRASDTVWEHRLPELIGLKEKLRGAIKHFLKVSRAVQSFCDEINDGGISWRDQEFPGFPTMENLEWRLNTWLETHDSKQKEV